MKDKSEVEPSDSEALEYELQKRRILKIIQHTMYRLKLLSHLPTILENNGAILRRFLNKTEADFVVYVCQETPPMAAQILENRSDLELICNMLERINISDKKANPGSKKPLPFGAGEYYEAHVSYAVDVIFRCKPLVEHMETLEGDPDVLMMGFVDAIAQLESIVNDKLSISAEEEIKRENDLKTAFRLSMLLSNNIQEMEQLLEKQREELGKEHDRKEAILQDLAEKIDTLREKCNNQINKIVYDSEVAMMKDYNKSVEVQADLSQEAANSTHQYEHLLEEHLEVEKGLRTKRLKVEAQLASWVAKYDNDIGEKQTEYDELEKTYNEEKEELDLLQDQLEDQETEYLVLMKEKEEEEERINYEKAWMFLQNRAARRIQRAWRAYKARKLARRKKKGKKKGSAEAIKGKSGAKKSPRGKKEKNEKKGKKKDKKKTEPVKDELRVQLSGGPDPNALLEGKFRDDILGEIKSKEAFSKHELVVNLMKDETESMNEN